MDQTLFLQKKLIKWQKVLRKFPYQNIYDSDNTDERLTGGADSRVNNEENSNTVSADELPINIMESVRRSESNQNNHQQIPEYKEMDNIVKSAIQNIQEASNSLINLTESHEHELKTLCTTILLNLQKFINVIQERLSISINALNSLQLKLNVKSMELQTKNYELIQIRNELAKCREEALKFTTSKLQLTTQISTASTQTLQTINGAVAPTSKETIVHANSSQKMTIFTVSSSYQVRENESLPTQKATLPSMIVAIEPPIEVVTDQNNDLPQQVSIQSITNPSTISSINAIKNSIHNLIPQSLPENNSTYPLTNVVNHKLTHSQSEIPGLPSATENINLRIPVTSSIDQTQVSERLISDIHSVNQKKDGTGAIKCPISCPLHSTIANQVQSGPSSVFIEKPSSYRPSVPLIENSGLIIPEGELASSSGAKQPSQQQKEAEKNEREAQLLAKIEEICRENEKLKKDKLEYEHAVQKALYKGISSLNSEAIKILPNMPLICFQPCCIPCPYFPSSTSSILSEVIDDNKYIQAKSNISSKGKTQSRNQAKYFECYKPTKMCSQNNMIFLLPKKNLDSALINIPQLHIDRYNIETRKTVCHGGSCNKVAYKAQKHFDAIVGHELCKGNFQEYKEAVVHSNAVNSSGMNKSQRLRRCNGFAKSKRFINY